MTSRTLPVLALLMVGLPALAENAWPYESTDFTARVGALAQIQLQSMTDPVLAGTSDEFVVRRARIYAAGTVGRNIEWRLDTDDANQGRLAGNTSGSKNLTGIYLQDVVLTVLFSPALKLDSGLLVVDPSHHATIGATRLYAWDTFTYQGLQATALQDNSPAIQNNRELGVQARGLLLGGRLEYHLALTNGYRNGANDSNGAQGNAGSGVTVVPGVTTLSANNAFRTTARVQYNFLDNESAEYTTSGTYLGSRRIVSVSAGYDQQATYSQKVGEVFVDLPVHGGKDVCTLEASYWAYDGGTFLPGLLKQKDFSIQAGYNFGKRWNPMIRYESRRFAAPGDSALGTPLKGAAWLDTPADFNENREGLGFAYWFHGHNANFKAFYINVLPRNEASLAGVSSGLRAYHQFVAQLQIYVF